jgi:hypothetical protein
MLSLEQGQEHSIIGIVEAGELPVLTYSSEGSDKKTLKMRRKSRTDHFPCVAISHVRAGGLGNSEDNALPRCIVEWLQTIVDEMYDVSEHPVSFWIDTICLPIQRHVRKSVIRHMRRTFSECDRVLVLESSLYNTAATLPADQFLLIKKSAWLTRLWTLQEGAVAKELYFRFQRSVTQLEPLLEDCKTSKGLQRLIVDNVQDLEQLSPRFDDLDLLGFLDDDMKSFESSLCNNSVSASNSEKHQLRSILRIGYLSLPRFRYFATAEEIGMFPTVLSAVRQTYKDRPLRKSGSRDIWEKPAFLRLQEVLGNFPRLTGDRTER